MKRVQFIILISFTFSLFGKNLSAQDRDAGLWLGIEVEKNITQKFSIAVNPQIRFNDNYSELGTALSDLKINYKLTKNLKASINYRIANNRQLDNNYDARQRFFVDLAYKFNVAKFSITERLRFQDQVSFAGEDAGFNKMFVRSKLSVKYDTEGKIKPFVSGDTWYSLQYGYITNFRFALGFNYELNKLSSVEAAYLINKPIAKNNGTTSFILSLAFNYSF